MSKTYMTLCVQCFERVLGCSDCDDCDANRYCPGHYFLRAHQQGRLQGEGALFDAISHAPDEDEFVRLVNRTFSMPLIQTF